MTGPDDTLVFVPLGGVGEIGMNLALYGIGPVAKRKWLMVDCGVSFASEEHLPGIDLILPDISFIEEERADLAGIVLTHGHEDHFGALADLWPRLGVPVYATEFTAALLEAKLAEERGAPRIPVTTVAVGARLEIGPFDVEFVRMAHSIPEPNAIAIRTSSGVVLHTGDWKIDPDPVVGPPMDEKRLKAIGDEGCRAVVGDSTNALRDGVSPSESDVAAGLTELIKESRARVAVTCFASNVARIRSVGLAAAEADRQVVVVGRAMHRVIGVARGLGMLDGVPNFLSEDNYGYLPRDKVVLLCTGSQGEPRAALTRIAADRHPRISLAAGDRVVYSARVIPGNDREVGRVLNALLRQEIEVVTDRTHMVHVSGHPRRGEIEQLYKLLRPEAVVPVHGEAVHLTEHARLARELGIEETVTIYNGDMVRLAPGPLEVVDQLAAGRLYKDGRIIESEDTDTARERRSLGYAGIITVSLVVDDRGELMDEPHVFTSGLPRKTEDDGSFDDLVLDAIDDTFDVLPRARRRDISALRDTLRRAVRSAVEAEWGKRPNCEITVHQV